MSCSILALVALASCGVDALSTTPVQMQAPIVQCNLVELAECNTTAHAAVDYEAQGVDTNEEKCKAVAIFEQCRKTYSSGCTGTQATEWAEEQTKMQQKLNLELGADCSSVLLSGHPPVEGSSGDSGSKSWGSVGSDGVSSGSYIWQTLLGMLCFFICCAGAIAGVAIFSTMKKSKGSKGQRRMPESDEDESDYYDGEYGPSGEEE
jgi:hypothetical protein